MKYWPPTVTFRLACETRPSRLPGAGVGVFAREAAPQGSFLGLDLPRSAWILTAREALDLPDDVRPYSWRHVEHLCFRGGEGQPTVTAYFNHSFEPNVLWHLGCYFAQTDIAVGDELFLDYQILIDPLWSGRILDTTTGRPLEGMEWRRALLAGCRTLTALLEASLTEDVSDDDGPD